MLSSAAIFSKCSIYSSCRKCSHTRTIIISAWVIARAETRSCMGYWCCPLPNTWRQTVSNLPCGWQFVCIKQESVCRCKTKQDKTLSMQVSIWESLSSRLIMKYSIFLNRIFPTLGFWRRTGRSCEIFCGSIQNGTMKQLEMYTGKFCIETTNAMHKWV